MDPAIKRALLGGMPTSEVAITFQVHPYTVSRWRRQLGIKAWSRGRRQGLDVSEGQAMPYTAQRRELAEDDLPSYREVIAAGRDMERKERKLLEFLLAGVHQGRASSAHILWEVYGCRVITPSEHFATIGKRGYTPWRNGNGNSRH